MALHVYKKSYFVVNKHDNGDQYVGYESRTTLEGSNSTVMQQLGTVECTSICEERLHRKEQHTNWKGM